MPVSRVGDGPTAGRNRTENLIKVRKEPDMKTNLTSILIALCLGVLCATPIRLYPACTNTVQNANDSGPGSLREALASATNGETITFCPGISKIMLASGELVVDKSVTILGPGAGLLAIDGNGTFRVFHVSSSASATIAGLTITNGNVDVAAYPSYKGGGIWIDTDNLIVSNCVISGCHSFMDGGGIHNEGSNLRIVNSTISGNTARIWGAGVHSTTNSTLGKSQVEILNSTISDNKGGHGGGIINLSTMT